MKFAHSFTFSPTFIGYIKSKYADKHAKGMHFIGKNATKRTYNLEDQEKLSVEAGSGGCSRSGTRMDKSVESEFIDSRSY